MAKKLPKVRLSAGGSASAPYDQVFFKITISELGESGSRAKNRMADTADAVLAYVDLLISEGAAKNKVALLKVAPHTIYKDHGHVPAGYKASLEVTFMTEQPVKAAEIQDRLTEFPQSRVEALAFGVKDIESLREKAVEDAWATVARRFEHSLRTTVGSSSLGWDVSDWDINYEEHRPMTKLSAPTDDEGGTATVRVTLTVTWRKR